MRVVFVHGAFVRDGAWWWAPVAARLDVASEAVALPSCGEAGVPPTGAGPGLPDDAAALASILDSGGPAVVVAHSYGGMVASQAARHPAVRHLIYVSSFLPNVGDTLAGMTVGPDPVPVQPHPDGSVSVLVEDPTAFDERFLHDVSDAALIDGAHDRLTAQSAAVFGAAVTEAAWQHVPSTYLVCSEDRSTLPALQRVHAARATHAADLPTSHHPFQSRPDLVAEHVQRIVRAAESSATGA